MKCLIPGCKGTLVISYRQCDLHPFITCSNYNNHNRDKVCDFTESLTEDEVHLIKSEQLSPREVIEKHYSK